MKTTASWANKDSKMLANCKGCFIKSGSKFLTLLVEI